MKLNFPSDTNQALFEDAMEEAGLEYHSHVDDLTGTPIVRVECNEAEVEWVAAIAQDLGGLEV